MVSKAIDQSKLRITIRLDLELIPCCRQCLTSFYDILQAEKLRNELESQTQKSRLTYQLEKNKERCIKEIAAVDEELASHRLPKDLNVLLQLSANLQENQGKELLTYDQCSILIEKLMNHNEFPENALEKPISEIHQDIRNLINSLPIESRGSIWGSLYVSCAGGVIEDRWAEIHFPQFLSELAALVDEKAKYLRLFYILENHRWALSEEWSFALRAQQSLQQLPIYDRCSQLIEELIQYRASPENHPLEKLLCDIHQDIRDLINSLPLESRGWIWGSLYTQCAGGMTEDRWSEVHFPEFLSTLQGLVNQGARVHRLNLPHPLPEAPAHTAED